VQGPAWDCLDPTWFYLFKKLSVGQMTITCISLSSVHPLHGVSVAYPVSSCLTNSPLGLLRLGKATAQLPNFGWESLEGGCVTRMYKSSPNLTSGMRKEKSPPGTWSSAREGLSVLVTPGNWPTSSHSAKGRLKLPAIGPQEHM